jgi:signal transduction histidine kinase
MMSKYKNLSLRWKLSLLITVVAIYTATTIALAVYYLWTDQIKTEVNHRLQQNTELTANSVHKELNYEQKNLKAWSQLDVMVDIMSDDLDKRIVSTLKLLKKNYQLTGHLIVIDSHNKIIATTNSKSKEKAKYKIDTKQYVTFKGNLNSSAEIVLMVPIKLAFLPNNKAAGFLILTHPWKNIATQLANSLHDFLITQNDIVFQFSDKSLTPKMLQSSISANENFWLLNDQEVLHSNQVNLFSFNNMSIDIYGIANKNEAFKPINATIRLIGIVSLILLLPIFIISLWSANRFLKPIFDLQKVAENIAESGNLSLNIPIHAADEIGKLAQILNKMTKNLKQAFEDNSKSNEQLRLLTENLESRVEERTNELKNALKSLKNAQSQLVQSEKMSSLGQLVAGIAHELNNPISSVHVNTPMLKQYVADLVDVIEFIIKNTDDNTPIKQEINMLLDKIDYTFVKEDIIELLTSQEDAAKRIRDIVLSLRTFSRLDEAEIKSIDINQGIDDTIKILRHELKHRIEIHRDYQLKQQIECFPGEINQVILNIIANAAQAIKDKGNIWLATCCVNNDTAKIIISDDGSGLPDSLKSKIFDPFFTTKPVGLGTGLGLSISYGIIEKHHGKISVEDNVPHGAKFIIEIPIKQEKI